MSKWARQVQKDDEELIRLIWQDVSSSLRLHLADVPRDDRFVIGTFIAIQLAGSMFASLNPELRRGLGEQMLERILSLAEAMD